MIKVLPSPDAPGNWWVRNIVVLPSGTELGVWEIQEVIVRCGILSYWDEIDHVNKAFWPSDFSGSRSASGEFSGYTFTQQWVKAEPPDI